jgi:hypothetical protein
LELTQSRDIIIHELSAIVGENYLLLEKGNLIVYRSSIFQVMSEIVVLLRISASPADAKERLGALRAQATAQTNTAS